MKMIDEDVNAYISLSISNSHLYGIATTNAFGTGTDIEEVEEAEALYFVVGKLVSRASGDG